MKSLKVSNRRGRRVGPLAGLTALTLIMASPGPGRAIAPLLSGPPSGDGTPYEEPEAKVAPPGIYHGGVSRRPTSPARPGVSTYSAPLNGFDAKSPAVLPEKISRLGWWVRLWSLFRPGF